MPPSAPFDNLLATPTCSAPAELVEVTPTVVVVPSETITIIVAVTSLPLASVETARYVDGGDMVVSNNLLPEVNVEMITSAPVPVTLFISGWATVAGLGGEFMLEGVLATGEVVATVGSMTSGGTLLV